MIKKEEIINIDIRREGYKVFHMRDKRYLQLVFEKEDVAIVHRKGEIVLARLILPFSEIKADYYAALEDKTKRDTLCEKVVNLYNRYFPMAKHGYFHYKRLKTV